MVRLFQFFPILCLCFPFFLANAQAPSPAQVQEKIREWVRVQQTISEEKADWADRKSTMANLNAIRKKEIAQLDEIIAAAGTKLSDADAEKAKLEAEEKNLQEKRDTTETRIAAFEEKIRAELPRLPPILLEKIDDAVTRLTSENAEPPPLQNRVRDVVAILVEAGKFDHNITVTTEIVPIDDQKIEVDVVYVGLKNAFYLDRTKTNAGTGQPGENGWVWTPQNSLANEIAKTIAIQKNETPPEFVKLPFGKNATPAQ